MSRYHLEDWVKNAADSCENSTPRRDTARAQAWPPRAESGEASTIRHSKETADREVDLLARKLENGSKPGRKQIER